ncbi:hypothetical protein P7K49_022445 [Saguinus oedipus]|uniref:Uncharacterized protein n=1 Tax=Saguinus oedipus TaxID=9490 RepID=A0ABQ9UVN2_SAGOE|nr:hypothetical protein P7K49_022445 [Saguinus oedipus]
MTGGPEKGLTCGLTPLFALGLKGLVGMVWSLFCSWGGKSGTGSLKISCPELTRSYQPGPADDVRALSSPVE